MTPEEFGRAVHFYSTRNEEEWESLWKLHRALKRMFGDKHGDLSLGCGCVDAILKLRTDEHSNSNRP